MGRFNNYKYEISIKTKLFQLANARLIFIDNNISGSRAFHVLVESQTQHKTQDYQYLK